ncbi:MAG: hypothetical protein AAFX96_07505 [Pseudomonadota bacterium]
MIKPILCKPLLEFEPSNEVGYEWIEWDIRSYYYYAEKEQQDQHRALTINANLSLTLAICEWVLKRFEALTDIDATVAYVESGWAGILDIENTEYFQIRADEWRGPVLGPLMIVQGIISEAFFEMPDDPDRSWHSCYAFNLARHVMEGKSTFETWYGLVFDRLLENHSMISEEIVEDVLSHKYNFGRVVPREAFDLDNEYDPAQGEVLLRAFVRDRGENHPFIKL